MEHFLFFKDEKYKTEKYKTKPLYCCYSKYFVINSINKDMKKTSELENERDKLMN